jgi:hypothetical protein
LSILASIWDSVGPKRLFQTFGMDISDEERFEMTDKEGRHMIG